METCMLLSNASQEDTLAFHLPRKMEIHHNPSSAKDMVVRSAFLHMVLILWSIYPLASARYNITAQPGCNSICGGVKIHYPFGMTYPKCYMNEQFEIECRARNNSGSEKPFLKSINLEVTEINVNEGIVWIKNPIYRHDCTRENAERAIKFSGSPFVYSQRENKFVAVGCNKLVLVQSDDSKVTGCASICDENEEAKIELGSGCYGRQCCETSLPLYLSDYRVTISVSFILGGGRKKASTNNCTYAMIAAENYPLGSALKDLDYVPAVLEWEIFNSSAVDPNAYCYNTSITSSQKEHSGWRCQCHSGFYGNPYVLGGCEDPASKNEILAESFNEKNRTKWAIVGVSSSVGSILLLIGVWRLHKILRRRRKQKRKEKNFRQNGGLLLRQRLSSGEVNFDKSRLFNLKDLEQATDCFNVNRVLGKGGQGTVYKGMLIDGQIVAIKKFKVKENVEEFINEVLILSQINHRNVVKLLGFCLESEVPLLVYEFIPNGNLFQYLHDQNGEIPMTWEMRLRIATEIAGALFYLHSAASQPIYHRDIKSTNILLDEKYKAKVADFGTSRMVTIEDTHLTTLVQGTFGYLDPEYFYTSQFTEKSDVYSFGVVLVELLTGQKAVSSSYSTRREEAKSLVLYFIMSLEEDSLFDILDKRIMEREKEDIIAVAKLAKRCLELNGRKRPTMKEVTMELEGIPKLEKMSNIAERNHEEIKDFGIEPYQPWTVGFASTGATLNSTTSSSSVVLSFLSSK